MIQQSSIVSFLIIVTIFIGLLVGYTLRLIYIHKIKQIIYIDRIDSIKWDTQKQICKEISRDIHDDIIKSMEKALFDLQQLKELDNISGEKINYSFAIISKSIHDLHDFSAWLKNSDEFNSTTLTEAIQDELKDVERQNIISKLDVKGSAIPLESKKGKAAFLIIKEALSNIIKHSGAKFVLVTLEYHTNYLGIRVSDDGKGLDQSSPEKKTRGLGINNIKSRIKDLKGSFVIDSSASGTCIQIKIPLNHE